MYSLYYAYLHNHSVVVGCRIDNSENEAKIAIMEIEKIPRKPFFSAGKIVDVEPKQSEIEKDLNVIRKHLMGDSF